MWPVRNIDRNRDVPASILLLEKRVSEIFKVTKRRIDKCSIKNQLITRTQKNSTNQNHGLPRKDAIHEKKTIISLTIKSSECDTYRKMNITDYDGKRKYKYFN